MNERLCEVNSVVDVVDGTGKVVGALHPGHKYSVLDESSLEFAVGETYLMIRLPDHSIGYVARRHVLSDSRSESDSEPELDLEPESEDDSGGRPPWLTAVIVCALMIVGLVVGRGVAISLSDDGGSLEGTDDPAESSDGDSDDIAGGALPFRVVEGVSLEQRFFSAGFSADFAFGSTPDVESGISSRQRMAVVDIATGQEVDGVLDGYDPSTFVSSVLDRGSEVWVGLANERKILVFDPGCVCVSREIEVGSQVVEFMLEHSGQILFPDWDNDERRAVVTAIDPQTGNVVGRVVAPGAFNGSFLEPTLFGDRLWLPEVGGLREIDTLTMSLVKTVDLDGGPFHSVESLGSLFVVEPWLGLLHAVDPVTGDVRTVELAEPFSDGGIVLSELVADDVAGFIWVHSRGELLSVDPHTLEVVHRVQAGARRDPVLARGHVWIPSGDRLIVVNPETGETVADLPGPGAPFLIESADENELWLQPVGSPTLSTPNGVVDIVGVTYLLEDP